MNSQRGRRVVVEGGSRRLKFGFSEETERDPGDKKAMEEAANGTEASESELPEEGTSLKDASTY